MSGFEGVIVSDPRLQSQFTQVELRSLKAKFSALKLQSGHVTVSDLPPVFAKLKGINGMYTENEVRAALEDSYPDVTHEIDFESFLREYLGFQGRASGKGTGYKRATSILRQSTTTHFHVISESEKESYVTHINNHLAEDPFLKKFLPLDPKTNQLFELAKDGVLLCKLINLAVPGTIDERAINTKKTQNPWERNENHTLCLNSAKAIGCTVVNIGTQDLVEGRRHLVMGLISQIIKIQLLADLNLKKTPQLVELVEDNQDVEELMNLPPDKVLLKWMNFQLKKSGYKKEVTNFSTDLKDGEAYAHLLNVLAPEHKTNSTLETKDPTQRAKLIVEQAGKLDCNRYISPKDIVEGSTNLNLTFVAQIFQHRNGLTAEVDTEKISLTNVLDDDLETSREERCFRLWINSLGVSSYVNNLFEDVRQGWVLLEVLDKVFPGSVNWRHANKPPIKMPFKKVENCNQVVDIGKRLNFSLVNVAGNDIVQGNKKLIIAFLWQLMRFTMLRLLKNLRSFSQGREITDAHILEWANKKVKSSGKSSQIDSFKDKSLSSGIFFLELLSAVEPRVVDWTVVTKGEEDEDKKLNASYIISVARKLGCSIFLLPEDIVEVNQKMILTLTASIMYWSLQKKPGQLDVLEETEDASPTADEDSVDPEDASPTAVEDLTDPAEASPSAIENLTDPAEASPSAIEKLTDPAEASPSAIENLTDPDKASPFAVEGSADLAEPSSPAVEGSTDSAKASQSLLEQPKEK